MISKHIKNHVSYGAYDYELSDSDDVEKFRHAIISDLHCNRLVAYELLEILSGMIEDEK